MEPNRTCGRYKLIERIGAGGMAEIWKGVVEGEAGFRKLVAVKRVLPEIAEDKDLVEMFVQEAKLVADLSHPNIVQVLELGKSDGEYFIAMEYVPGANLGRVLKRCASSSLPFPLAAAVYATVECAKGLGHAHTRADESGRPRKIVHRDISPQNILVSPGGDVKIGDFGIARFENAVSRTAAGNVRGKLAYMSPEQLAGKPLDGRSDLFSLALVLFEMVTGRRFFSGMTEPEVVEQLTSYQGMSEDALAMVPAPIRGAMRTALAREPDARHASAREFESALTEAIGGAAIIEGREHLSRLVRACFPEEPGAVAVADVPTSPEMPVAAASIAAPIAVPEQPHPGTVVLRSGSRVRRWPFAIAGVVALLILAGLWLGGGAVSGTGQLSVTARPWVEVWVDGRKITARTPVAGYSLPAGKHRIRFVYQPSRFAEERAVVVPRDGHVSVDVDVGSGTIDVR